MAKKSQDAEESVAGSEPVTRADVAKLIAAAFIRHDAAHGHLSAEDAEQQLRALDESRE